MNTMLQLSKLYHIYNHGNGDDNLFREERNYPFFLSKLKFHTEAFTELIAYCLMPNHFHLLVRIKDAKEIPDHPGFENLDGLDINKRINQSFSNFFNCYTKAFNKTYGRRGSLFLKNYKRKEIDSDNYMRTLIHYIHCNPIHHGFTDKIDSWKWSSLSIFTEQSRHWTERLFDSENNYTESLTAFRASLNRLEIQFE